MLIRPVHPADKSEWLRMRKALWPEYDDPNLLADIDRFFAGEMEGAVFVAERESGGLGGFIEASTRAYANGCEAYPVGYIEGWYVDTDLRRSGLGKKLVEAAEAWAAGQGYTQMGSDCDISNDVSFRAHLALGYEEKERVICFCKNLSRSS